MAIVVLVCAVAAIGWCLVLHARSADQAASLPAHERRELVERTLTTLRTTCTRPLTDELDAFCRAQATFIARLPECDDDCHAVASQFVPRPTR